MGGRSHERAPVRGNPVISMLPRSQINGWKIDGLGLSITVRETQARLGQQKTRGEPTGLQMNPGAMRAERPGVEHEIGNAVVGPHFQQALAIGRSEREARRSPRRAAGRCSCRPNRSTADPASSPRHRCSSETQRSLAPCGTCVLRRRSTRWLRRRCCRDDAPAVCSRYLEAGWSAPRASPRTFRAQVRVDFSMPVMQRVAQTRALGGSSRSPNRCTGGYRPGPDRERTRLHVNVLWIDDLAVEGGLRDGRCVGRRVSQSGGRYEQQQAHGQREERPARNRFSAD